MKSFDDKISIKRLISEYRQNVVGFHNWWLESIEKNLSQSVVDYRFCRIEIKRIQQRAWYNLILNRALQIKVDPYEYIKAHMKKEHLDVVMALPNNSKEQVDKIIEFEDEYSACDEQLAKLAYKVFKVECV